MGVPPTDVHVTYRQQLVRCSKPSCTVCAPGGPCHGPYWYAYWRKDGRKRSCYIGKERPAAASQPIRTPAPRLELPSTAPDLPTTYTSFVGRERDIVELKRLLARPPRRATAERPSIGRLITLTGTGGCGKSRLALEVARDVRDDYPGGLWHVDLASLADPDLVPQTVAAALGLPEGSGRTWTATLTAFLWPHHLLLLLDHCGHLLDACAGMLTTLLASCPHLQVLATSEEPLGVPGEVMRAVPSLGLPDPDRLSPLDRLARCDSVRLFLDRGQTARPDFTLTAHNAQPIAQVCRRLDGIPLALELAASQLAERPVEEVIGLLHERFEQLAGTGIMAMSRRQTVRAALDWSYGLLDRPTQLVLQRLTVCAGGCTEDLARTVCAGHGVAVETVPDLLAILVRDALLAATTHDGVIRYQMQDGVREYARERIQPADATRARARHRAWCLALAEQAATERHGPAQASWLDQLETEHDNLRAALIRRQGDAAGDTPRLKLVVALRWFWDARGYLGEGRRRLETLLVECVAAEPLARAWALVVAGDFARRQGDYARAGTLLGEALALCNALGEKAASAAALAGLGNVATYQGDLDRAWTLHQQSLTIRRALDDRQGVAGALDNLAEVALLRRDLETAATLYAECLVIAETLDDRLRRGSALNGLGYTALWQEDLVQAAACFKDSLTIQMPLGDRFGITFTLEGLAMLTVWAGDAAPAALLFGAVETLRLVIGTPLQPVLRQEHDRALAHLRADTDQAAVDAAWARGKAMTLAEVVEAALA